MITIIDETNLITSWKTIVFIFNKNFISMKIPFTSEKVKWSEKVYEKE